MPINEANVFVGRARLKAKDIREALKGRNIDPVIIQTLEGLADNDKTQRDQIEAVADAYDKLMDLVSKLIFIMDSIKEKVPDLNKLNEAGNVLNTNLNAVIKNTARDAIKQKLPEET
jgi:NurA-like 5'-3' nuclease